MRIHVCALYRIVSYRSHRYFVRDLDLLKYFHRVAQSIQSCFPIPTHQVCAEHRILCIQQRSYLDSGDSGVRAWPHILIRFCVDTILLELN